MKLLYPAETFTSLSCANLSPASRSLLLGRILTHQAKTHHVRIWSKYCNQSQTTWVCRLSLSLCWVMVRPCYRSNWRCMREAITFGFAIPIMKLLGSNYRRLLSEVLIRAKPTNQGTSCWGTSGGSFEAVLRQSILHNVARLGASGKSGIRCIQIVRTMRETIKDCGSYELFLRKLASG